MSTPRPTSPLADFDHDGTSSEIADETGAMQEVIASLDETSERCRAVSERTRARSTAPTLPALRIRDERTSELRPPAPGQTDVVKQRPDWACPPTSRRRPPDAG